jgi:hypothetical protein
LNGQVAADGNTTYPIYWVDSTYAAMTMDASSGTANPVVASSSSHPSFGVYATRDPTTATVTALIGRHETCGGGMNLDCGESAAPAVDVPIAVTFPFTAPSGVHVLVQRIPIGYMAAPLSAPATVVDQIVTPADGVVSLVIPQVADGDAIVVTLAPA